MNQVKKHLAGPPSRVYVNLLQRAQEFYYFPKGASLKLSYGTDGSITIVTVAGEYDVSKAMDLPPGHAPVNEDVIRAEMRH